MFSIERPTRGLAVKPAKFPAIHSPQQIKFGISAPNTKNDRTANPISAGTSFDSITWIASMQCRLAHHAPRSHGAASNPRRQLGTAVQQEQLSSPIPTQQTKHRRHLYFSLQCLREVGSVCLNTSRISRRSVLSGAQPVSVSYSTDIGQVPRYR